MDDLASSHDRFSLRDLGGAEPSFAPRHQPPMPPLTALVRSTSPHEPSGPTISRRDDTDSRWLVHFAIIAAIAGLVAIVLIAILRH